MGIWVYGHMGIWVYGSMGLWVHGSMRLCVYVSMCICVYVYMCICVYVYMCIRVCIYIYITCIYIYICYVYTYTDNVSINKTFRFLATRNRNFVLRFRSPGLARLLQLHPSAWAPSLGRCWAFTPWEFWCQRSFQLPVDRNLCIRREFALWIEVIGRLKHLGCWMLHASSHLGLMRC